MTLWPWGATLGTDGHSELGQGTQGWTDSLASLLHLLSLPQEAPLDGKEVSRSREAGGLGTAHLIPVIAGAINNPDLPNTEHVGQHLALHRRYLGSGCQLRPLRK